MQKHHRLSLIEHLRQVPDPRVMGRCDHELVDVLVIGLCCLLCGGETFGDMADFGRAKEAWFRTFLRLRHGIPTHDTFNRVFAALKPEAFLECFMRWTQSVRTAVRRGDFGTGRQGVAACGRRGGLAPCSRQRVGGEQLAGAGAGGGTGQDQRDYGLAGIAAGLGTGRVHRDAGRHGLPEGDRPGRSWKPTPTMCWRSKATRASAMRRSKRYWQSGDLDWFAGRPEWTGLRSVGMVESLRQMGAQPPTTERRYYLSSLPVDVKEFARAVRGHWSVKNSLHWVLDVQCGEDRSRARTGHAGANLATLRRLALNLLKRDSSLKRGIKGKQLNAAWDHAYLLRLLAF